MPIVNNIFSYTGGTEPGPAGSPISSTKRQTRDDDIKSAFNTAASIVRGGIGATDPVGGADNLSTTSSDIASATTTDLSTATGQNVTITGTTTIAGFGTVQNGAKRYLTFDGALILTYNATSLILPTGTDITTASGDTMVVQSLGSNNWRCISYTRLSGRALVGSGEALHIANVPPTVDNDSTEGFVIGSRWYDDSAEEAYELFDPADGAALWVLTTLTTDDLGTSAVLDKTTVAQIRNNTPDKVVSTDQMWASIADVVVASAASIELDFNAGSSFRIDTLQHNATFTIASGSATKVNQEILIKVIENGAGSHTISWGAGFVAENSGTFATHSDTAGAFSIFSGIITASGEVFIVGSKKDIA